MGRGLGLAAAGGLVGGGTASPPADQEVDDQREDAGDHHVVEVVELLAPFLPTGADLDADDSKHQDPGNAACRREGGELPEGHVSGPCGSRDEGPNDRQHPGEEDGDRSVALEPALDALHLLRADVEDVMALQQLLSAPVADRVAGPRADDVPEHAGGGDSEQGEFAVVHLEPGEQHGRLAGHRDVGALHEHEKEDPGVADLPDHVHAEVDQGVHDEIRHERGMVGATTLAGRVERLTNPVYRHRLIQIAADGVLIAAAFYLAFRLRFLDAAGGIPDRYQEMLVQTIGFVVVGTLIVFYVSGLYEKWWRYFRLPDMVAVLRACAISTAILALTFLLLKPFDDQIPRSVVVMEFLLTVFLVGGARAVARMVLVERIARRDAVRGAREVLVVGAGSGGQMVVRELQLNPNLGSRAIGFLDDDPRKRGMRLHGINVLGATDEIGEVLDELTPNEVIIAIPSAPGELRGKVVTACRERDVPVRTLPTVFELLRGGVQLTRQLREVQVEDVLGRDPVLVELDRVGAYLQDRIVLVTGAGGSIGAELCRQIARVRPRLLVMLDHAEDNLFEVERELVEERHFAGVESVLADCKEADRMLEVMGRFKPEIVFHAAAYKHVPLMESNPLEAIRNNAIATRITAE